MGRPEWRPERGGEHEPVILVVLTKLLALEALAIFLHLERRQGVLRQLEGPHGSRRLATLAEVWLAVLRPAQRSSDRQQAGSEVDVIPLQAQQLAASTTRVHR